MSQIFPLHSFYTNNLDTIPSSTPHNSICWFVGIRFGLTCGHRKLFFGHLAHLDSVSTDILRLLLPSVIRTIRFGNRFGYYNIITMDTTTKSPHSYQPWPWTVWIIHTSLWIWHHYHHHPINLSHHHFKWPNLHCTPPLYNIICWRCPGHTDIAAYCRRLVVSEYCLMLLDDSEQAFGEIIIALIEFIMICWLGIGNFPPCIIYLMVHIEHVIYLRYPP